MAFVARTLPRRPFAGLLLPNTAEFRSSASRQIGIVPMSAAIVAPRIAAQCAGTTSASGSGAPVECAFIVGAAARSLISTATNTPPTAISPMMRNES